MDQSLEQRLEFAISAAKQAGKLTLEYFFGDQFEVESKADESPVTIADREAERLLRQLINEQYPADGILGEEFPEQSGSSGYRWIVDPIDGTKSFIHRVPLYGTMVGLEYSGESVLGVIVVPALEECVYAAKGLGCWYQRGEQAPQKAQVSQVDRLSEALFVTSEVANFDKVNRHDLFDRLQAHCRLCRTWGDCYGYMLVATGRAELMVDPIVNLWDTAALQPIIEEAGGTFTDWQGRATIYSGQAVATNGRVYDEVMALIQKDINDK